MGYKSDWRPQRLSSVGPHSPFAVRASLFYGVNVPYFMVGVSISVEAVYPLQAEDERAAMRKAEELVASCAVCPPSSVEGCIEKAPSSVSCAPSDEGACARLAAASFDESQAKALLGDMVEDLEVSPTPPSMARSAKAVLERSGSGELRPSARRRG